MNLASVEKIVNIRPIPDSDNIECATVLGWDIVVKKDEYQIGSLCGYIQIDTVVPECELFEFLRPRNFRVRTIKLRKQLSQGLIVPLPNRSEQSDGLGSWKEGDDLTEIYGVKKFSKEPELIEEKRKMPKVWYKKLWFKLKYNFLVKIFPSLKTFNRASFPKELVSITDEPRIQNMPHVLDQYKGKVFVISEKLDGSSITIIHDKKPFKKEKFRICSRRFELFNTKNEWHQVFIDTNFKKHIINLVEHFMTNRIIVQGEFIGKPQGNKLQVENQIRLFNIYVNGKRLAQNDFYDVCAKYGIPCCPLITSSPMFFNLPEILEYAQGKSLLNDKVEREGIVCRCIEDHLSFKVISNKWLLLNNE